MKTTIIYEDKDILVIQKPAGLATQTARIGQADVVSELKNYLAGQEQQGNRSMKAQEAKSENYLGVIHRLDQPVEGLLVFAKNKAAAASLTKQLAGGTLNKQYYAVICGQPLRKEGKLVDYLVKEDNMAKVVTGKQEQYPEAKRAVLEYRTMQDAVSLNSLSLVDIHIDTGRFHQIRVQMSHAGMALLGDLKYADATTKEAGSKMGIRNVALCAYSLDLEHPVTKQKLHFHIKPAGKAFSYFNILE